MKPLTRFIQGISIVTSEMSDAVFYETKLCLKYIPIFLTFLPRVKLQSQQTNNGFKSKNGIIRTTVGYLSGGRGFSIYLFLEGGCSTSFCRTGQGSFFASLTNFIVEKVVEQTVEQHFVCCPSVVIQAFQLFLNVGWHTPINDLKSMSTGLLGRF